MPGWVRWYLKEVFICISLTRDIEHLKAVIWPSVCLRARRSSSCPSSESCVFSPIAHLLTGSFHFLGTDISSV